MPTTRRCGVLQAPRLASSRRDLTPDWLQVKAVYQPVKDVAWI